MATYKLALIIKSSLNEDEFLLVRQTPPPKFGDEEYDSYVDSDLWDLPSVPLKLLEADSRPRIVIEGADSCSDKLDLNKFDVDLALDQVLTQVGFGRSVADGHWAFWKYIEEAGFGPGSPVQTVFILGKLIPKDESLPEMSKWMSIKSCLNLLLEVNRSTNRVGPLMVIGLLTGSAQPGRWKVPVMLPYQEYPPGVKVLPMGSRTLKPFHTTNLIVFVPESINESHGDGSFVAYGDALIVDPGCRSQFHSELKEIVASLPRKLVVFVTHHHKDHVDGLSIVQKTNPDAILLAHENTARRIRKDDWSLGYTSISGAEDICIGGERLNVILSPGHTDGHMALLHVSTNSLIVGDHCVGQGSAILDINSGGNMKDYFQTTYKFLELSPHALIPMHGRVNLWPKHMLCGYLKNRRHRESSILKAIESGAETLFEIVSKTYSDVHPSFWIPAGSNVKLHVDHLSQQHKLPEEFSLEKFRGTFGLHFFSRWAWAYLRKGLPSGIQKLRTVKLLTAVAVAGFAMVYTVRHKLISK